MMMGVNGDKEVEVILTRYWKQDESVTADTSVVPGIEMYMQLTRVSDQAHIDVIWSDFHQMDVIPICLKIIYWQSF